jgi:hypothetical protein
VAAADDEDADDAVRAAGEGVALGEKGDMEADGAVPERSAVRRADEGAEGEGDTVARVVPRPACGDFEPRDRNEGAAEEGPETRGVVALLPGTLRGTDAANVESEEASEGSGRMGIAIPPCPGSERAGGRDGT